MSSIPFAEITLRIELVDFLYSVSSPSSRIQKLLQVFMHWKSPFHYS